MELTLEVDELALENIQRRLELLALPKGKRKRVLKRTGQEVRKRSRQNIRQQKTVDGQPMAGRKAGKGKMFRKIGRTLTTKTYSNSVTVGWKNRLIGMTAYKHHHGVPERFTAKKLEKLHGQPDYGAPATKRQAKALITAGYRVYVGKKKGKVKTKKPSIRWITENMTQGRAGLMIRELTGDVAKSSWEVKVPARPFLGVSEKEALDILATEIQKE